MTLDFNAFSALIFCTIVPGSTLWLVESFTNDDEPVSCLVICFWQRTTSGSGLLQPATKIDPTAIARAHRLSRFDDGIPEAAAASSDVFLTAR